MTARVGGALFAHVSPVVRILHAEVCQCMRVHPLPSTITSPSRSSISLLPPFISSSSFSIIRLVHRDTAGQERFSSMMGTYYRNSKGAMLVYDIGDRSSLDAIGKWHKELVEHAAKDVVVVLVGNKSDLDDDRVVSVEEGAQVAKKYGVLFTEASAKTGAHVQTAFTDLMAGASL